MRRRIVEAVRRLSTEEGLGSLTGTTHIPAPEIHKPTVSPITQLGEKPIEEEPITQLGEKPIEEEPNTHLGDAKEEAVGEVITWLGEKSETEKKEEMEASAERLKNAEMDKQRAGYPILTDLPLEMLPSFTRRKLSTNNRDPLFIRDAFQQLLDTASKEYDNTVTMQMRLKIDPRKSNQFVRGICNLPHGTGRRLRIAVFAEESAAQMARDADAEIVGGSELIQEIMESEGKIVEDIDICVATPSMMTMGLAKLGRILGPRGLMPNPKAGTLTNDVAEAIGKLRGGQIEFRVDRAGRLQCRLGRLSFGVEKLLQNTAVYGKNVMDARPEMFANKPIEEFLQRITVTATKAAGIPVEITSFQTFLNSAGH